VSSATFRLIYFKSTAFARSVDEFCRRRTIFFVLALCRFNATSAVTPYGEMCCVCHTSVDAPFVVLSPAMFTLPQFPFSFLVRLFYAPFFLLRPMLHFFSLLSLFFCLTSTVDSFRMRFTHLGDSLFSVPYFDSTTPYSKHFHLFCDSLQAPWLPLSCLFLTPTAL